MPFAEPDANRPEPALASQAQAVDDDLGREGVIAVDYTTKLLTPETWDDFAALVEDFTNVFRRGWLNALVKLRVWMKRSRLAQEMNDPDAIVRGLRDVLDAPLSTEQLSRITARTLIVGGTRDQFFGEGRFEETAAAIPNAQLALFPDETHMVAVERRRDVAAKIAAFLRR